MYFKFAIYHWRYRNVGIHFDLGYGRKNWKKFGVPFPNLVKDGFHAWVLKSKTDVPEA